jgi:hypothetical protein
VEFKKKKKRMSKGKKKEIGGGGAGGGRIGGEKEHKPHICKLPRMKKVVNKETVDSVGIQSRRKYQY